MKEFDVVIIGAGLAGLQCARLLAANGATILLVDRKEDLTKSIHTTGIFVRKTLEDFDFPIGTLGQPVRRVKLFSPNLRILNLDSEKDEFRVGKMEALYESLLRECKASGVEFANGTRYILAHPTGSQDAGTGARAFPLAISAKRENTANRSKFSSDGSPQLAQTTIKLEKNGRSYEVKTKVLVGADGAVSRVAKDLKLDENKEWIVGYEEVYRNVTPAEEPVLNCFLDAKLAPGYLAWATNDGEEIHIGVGGYPAGFNPREALKLFKEKILGNIIDIADADLAETRGGRIPVGGILGRIANTYGLLIGDAAGAVSPLTAGGLDPCLRLSAFAAQVIAERLRTKDPEILKRYSGELFRARFVSRLWMRRTIAIFANQNLLELGHWVMRGRIGRKFAKHVFFGRGSFPDVEFGNSPNELVPKVVK